MHLNCTDLVLDMGMGYSEIKIGWIERNTEKQRQAGNNRKRKRERNRHR